MMLIDFNWLWFLYSLTEFIFYRTEAYDEYH